MLRTPLPDLGSVSLTEQDPVQQRHANHDRGDGGDARRHPVAFIPTHWTKPSRLPTDFSARIARNTQIVIQEETGMTKVVDPLGGSYYIESLTQELVDRAWEIIEKVEAEGGMAKAVAAGWPKAMIEEASAGRAARVDRKEDVIVGVNKYRLDKQEDPIDILDVDNVAQGARRPDRTDREGQGGS